MSLLHHPRSKSILSSLIAITALLLASRAATSAGRPAATTSADNSTFSGSSQALSIPVTGNGNPPVFLPLITSQPEISIPANIGKPTPVSSGDAVLVGAGDIVRCGDSGNAATANLVAGIPGTVAAIGDTQYDSGAPKDYANCYSKTWGAFKDRTRPAVGNHEYKTSGASGYQGYYGQAAGPAGKFYYSYELGDWHVVVLNSECSSVPGGCGAGSPQETWLKADLAAHPNQCTLAYWHEPLYSSGEHSNNPGVKTFWQDLYTAGVELVLNGHDHDYERFAPMDPSGQLDNAKGIREFVVGTGGGNLRPMASTKANSEVRIANVYGVIKLSLKSGSYDWQFLPVSGQKATDSGSAVCH